MDSSTGIPSQHWIARDPASLDVSKTVEKLKDLSSTILINGESGTGKDLLAGLIHFSGQRRDEPLLRIDCSSIPAELMESELFGYEKGAFTGAYTRKLGKLEFAGSGTIVLDEIATLGLETQAKLLRVIEEKEFERLGGHVTIPVHARLIALSREWLGDLVRSRCFREDLFFRLNVVPIQIPPLRERPRDIRPLAEFFLEAAAQKYGKPGLRIDPEVFAYLESYSFPGNVRELRNLVDRVVMLSDQTVIMPDQLPESVRQRRSNVKTGSAGERPTLAQMEKDYIAEILEYTKGKKGRAASILGISRKTLLEKRKRYGLTE
jgi:transcriptional regulator with PAS, ATPase and Fis domain